MPFFLLHGDVLSILVPQHEQLRDCNFTHLVLDTQQLQRHLDTIFSLRKILTVGKIKANIYDTKKSKSSVFVDKLTAVKLIKKFVIFNVIRTLIILSHRSGRQPQTYVKPEAAITVFELLMMGGVSPETC